MREYLLLLPIIFIFHDMEEIIGFDWFFKTNPDLFEHFPKLRKVYDGLTTATFAAAVYEEFIPFFGVSLLAYYFPNKILNAVWLGILLSLTAHFVVHILLSICIKKYVPCVITSFICLPVSSLIVIKSTPHLDLDMITVICIIISILAMIANIKLAHGFAHFLSKKTDSSLKDVKTLIFQNQQN